MPPAYLRAPSMIKAEQERSDGCATRRQDTKAQARVVERRLGVPAYRCSHCGHWHNSNNWRAAK